MFTADAIQARLREKPFVPVRLVTNTGESYDIRHPHLVMVGTRALIIGTPDRRDSSLFETAKRVALMNLTDMQDMPPATPSVP